MVANDASISEKAICSIRNVSGRADINIFHLSNKMITIDDGGIIDIQPNLHST